MDSIGNIKNPRKYVNKFVFLGVLSLIFIFITIYQAILFFELGGNDISIYSQAFIYISLFLVIISTLNLIYSYLKYRQAIEYANK